MRRALLALMLALPVFATQAHDPVFAGFIGAGAAQNSAWMFDVGLTANHVGAEHWGLHLGYLGRSVSSESLPTSIAPAGAQGYTQVVAYGGLQLGGYYDAGRAWIAAGAESLDYQTQTVSVLPDQAYSLGSPKQLGGLGGYLKVGLKVGRASLYVGYGSQTKGAVGLALHL